MPPLKPWQIIPGAAADIALGHRPRCGRVERGADMLGSDVLPVDIVQHPVPGLGHHRKAPEELVRFPLPHLGGDQFVADHADAVRVGQSDRRAQRAGLPDPLQAGHLSVAIEAMAAGEKRGLLLDVWADE